MSSASACGVALTMKYSLPSEGAVDVTLPSLPTDTSPMTVTMESVCSIRSVVSIPRWMSAPANHPARPPATVTLESSKLSYTTSRSTLDARSHWVTSTSTGGGEFSFPMKGVTEKAEGFSR